MKILKQILQLCLKNRKNYKNMKKCKKENKNCKNNKMLILKSFSKIKLNYSKMLNKIEKVKIILPMVFKIWINKVQL